MKKAYLSILSILLASAASAQIQITATDMPVVGDTLRSSATAAASSGITLSNTGTNYTWDFSSLVPVSQTVANYQLAATVNIAFAVVISPTAYGYKVADSFPTPAGLPISLPVSIKNMYTFYNKKTSPSRFVAEGFGATISGIPTPAAYQDEDEIYKFPLDYGTTNDSTTFDLKFSLASLGSVRQKGYRKTTVDGWGTIKTPFFTTAVNCIRVRSEIREIDSFTISPLPAMGIPRNTVEYKWLAAGEHYPVLWVTANITGSTETITSVRYRDQYRPGLLNIEQAPALKVLKAYPNPANYTVNIDVPTSWQNYTVAIYDMQGRVVANYNNTSKLDVSNLAKGNYLAVLQHENERAAAAIIKD